MCILQVTLESIPSHWASPSVSTRTQLGHTSSAITDFLKHQGWDEVVVVHADDIWNRENAESMHFELEHDDTSVIMLPLKNASAFLQVGD